MSRPANVTASASRRSRLPRHMGQSAPIMNCSARFRIKALCELAKLFRTCRRAPVKVPM